MTVQECGIVGVPQYPVSSLPAVPSPFSGALGAAFHGCAASNFFRIRFLNLSERAAGSIHCGFSGGPFFGCPVPDFRSRTIPSPPFSFYVQIEGKKNSEY